MDNLRRQHSFSVGKISSDLSGSARLTSLLCVQYMANGDSGEFLTMQVRLIVDPVLMKISGPPTIVVNGSAMREKIPHHHHHHQQLNSR